jgi:hypothetical protein
MLISTIEELLVIRALEFWKKKYLEKLQNIWSKSDKLWLFTGERRIRVHTMCLPVTNQLSEIYAGADQKAIIGLLAKMGKL